ncbi:DUF2637 domain-containing protein [Streptomyces sp. NPDC058045]|uniref:DUF2637 domain-containing protein n=1 Tax=Streptomyces sp. NPDC058045 TaxID=3346311 RepID=UPI0036F05EE4
MQRPATVLAAVAATASVVLTGIAFWLSYEHLASVADGNGLGDARAWAWPATVDLFIIVGELLMLRASLQHRIDPWAIGLATVGSIGSIALNVAGVGSSAHPMQYVVAAVPPSAALIAFGALMRQVHEALRNAETATTTPAAPQQETATQPVASPPPPATPPAAAPVATPAPAAPQRNAAPRRNNTEHNSAEPDPLRDAIDEAMAPVASDLDGVALLTVADVAAMKNVREGTVRSWVSRGRLAVAARDANGRTHFHPAAVAELD